MELRCSVVPQHKEEGDNNNRRLLRGAAPLQLPFFFPNVGLRCNATSQQEEEGGAAVATPLWPSVGVKPNTWKSWELESSGTPECSELDSKGQNTSHWGVLGVVEKGLET
jgi:hypothetical protein